MLEILVGFSLNEFALPLSISLFKEEDYKAFGITILCFNITFAKRGN